MLSTTKDSNKSLARGSKLNFLKISARYSSFYTCYYSNDFPLDDKYSLAVLNFPRGELYMT
jgi:hypothetical protein